MSKILFTTICTLPTEAVTRRCSVNKVLLKTPELKSLSRSFLLNHPQATAPKNSLGKTSVDKTRTRSISRATVDGFFSPQIYVELNLTIMRVIQDGSSRPEVFCKKGVLRNFAKFTGKRLCQNLFFSNVAGRRPATLLKKRPWHWCFPVNFTKFLRTPFLSRAPLVAASAYTLPSFSKNTSRLLLPKSL